MPLSALAKSAIYVSTIAMTSAIAGAFQEPTFRGGTDVIVLDVQVIDKDGFPITDLTPGKFHVTVDGRPRAIVSATLVGTASGRETAKGGTPAPNVGPSRNGDATPGQVGLRPELPPIVLAIDCLSFPPAAAFRVGQRLREFVSRLDAAQRVGLLAYPLAPGAIRPLITAAWPRRSARSVGKWRPRSCCRPRLWTVRPLRVRSVRRLPTRSCKHGNSKRREGSNSVSSKT